MAVNPYSTKYSSLIATPQKGSAEYGQVEKDAQQEYLDRLKAIDTRIKQVQALREADMAGIRRSNDLAQRDINDQMFREYLANRERMGGRGLSNSGLMADAQIRLNANKQDRLAQLYAQTQDKLSEVNRMYAPQQTELLGERSNTRQSKIFKDMLKELQDNRAREAQLLSPLVQNEFSMAEAQRNRAFQAGQAAESRRYQQELASKQEGQGKSEINAKIYADDAERVLQRQKDIQETLMEYSKLGTLTAEQQKEVDALQNQLAEAIKQEQFSRDLANAYMLNDPTKINDALFLYNQKVRGVDQFGRPIVTPVVQTPVTTTPKIDLNNMFELYKNYGGYTQRNI